MKDINLKKYGLKSLEKQKNGKKKEINTHQTKKINKYLISVSEEI